MSDTSTSGVVTVTLDYTSSSASGYSTAAKELKQLAEALVEDAKETVTLTGFNIFVGQSYATADPSVSAPVEEAKPKAAATKPTKAPKASTNGSGTTDSAAIREWARANGYPNLGSRGRIQAEIVEAFQAAH